MRHLGIVWQAAMLQEVTNTLTLPSSVCSLMVLQDLWGKVMWLWDRPHMQKLRLTVSMANFRCGVAEGLSVDVEGTVSTSQPAYPLAAC